MVLPGTNPTREWEWDMELTKLREQYAGWAADLGELRRVADELNLIGRLELWDRLTAATTFLRGSVLPVILAEADVAAQILGDDPLGALGDAFRLHDDEIACLADDFDDARRGLLVGEPTAKTTLRRTLYALHSLIELRRRFAEEIVLPMLTAADSLEPA